MKRETIGNSPFIRLSRLFDYFASALRISARSAQPASPTTLKRMSPVPHHPLAVRRETAAGAESRGEIEECGFEPGLDHRFGDQTE